MTCHLISRTKRKGNGEVHLLTQVNQNTKVQDHSTQVSRPSKDKLKDRAALPRAKNEEPTQPKKTKPMNMEKGNKMEREGRLCMLMGSASTVEEFRRRGTIPVSGEASQATENVFDT